MFLKIYKTIIQRRVIKTEINDVRNILTNIIYGNKFYL